MRNANEIALDVLGVALQLARRAADDYLAQRHLQVDLDALEQSVLSHCKAQLPTSLRTAAKLSDLGLTAWVEVELRTDMALAGIQAAQDVARRD